MTTELEAGGGETGYRNNSKVSLADGGSSVEFEARTLTIMEDGTLGPVSILKEQVNMS